MNSVIVSSSRDKSIPELVLEWILKARWRLILIAGLCGIFTGWNLKAYQYRHEIREVIKYEIKNLAANNQPAERGNSQSGKTRLKLKD